MQDQVSTLEVQLQEKEELVAVLTRRLEQAAEQLDRIRRTGGDRGLKLGGGFPPELVESQKTLVDDLQRAVAQWEQMQAGTTLERLDVQISEIRNLILEQGDITTGVQSPLRPIQKAIEDDDAHTDRRDEPPSDLGGGPDSWESLKAGLLATDTGPVAEEETVATVEEAPTQTGEAWSTAIAPPAEPEEIVETDPPEPIDFSTADTEALQAAVENRDEYISHLLKRLRVAESRQDVAPPDWATLDNAPEELRQRLQELEGRLEGTLRISEVELSLERARLSREEVRLRQIQEQVEKKMNMLGLSLEDGAPQDADWAADGADGGKGRRWLRFLGIGNSDEDESDER